MSKCLCLSVFMFMLQYDSYDLSNEMQRIGLSSHTQYNVFSTVWNIPRIPFLRWSQAEGNSLTSPPSEVFARYCSWILLLLKHILFLVRARTPGGNTWSEEIFREIFPAMWRPMAPVWSKPRRLICKGLKFQWQWNSKFSH